MLDFIIIIVFAALQASFIVVIVVVIVIFMNDYKKSALAFISLLFNTLIILVCWEMEYSWNPLLSPLWTMQ